MIGRLAPAVLALWLAGCAALPPPSAAPQLAAIPAAFEMSGRISIRLADRSDIARLRWTRRATGDLWIIASPLGNEVARLESSPAGATLAGAASESADSFAMLTERLLGVSLEPDQLAAWLHGTIPPEAPGGWQVTLDETTPAGSMNLARRLTATRGATVVRLVVDDYRVLAD